ncbi:MFS transporter [Ethanoligenens harbinense]|uniref:Major facilitator superfamily MFS_1 n=1 Tax=Ethanoligenens harbinense (strain DSM 18485 / JCM 12961 / CGMCC 1.5033 / YUAN-3) TaxID=663278 RepID=E6U753_ETHHY|nr:MFS transporter [Ethanoligenens harbinense]ADU28123.1 major facilitator superfamily MFS_1 [Ethanoligenens harbinense YUAN-3]AVQ97131.1 MFS transporter [Ethanoligenens harbinense YUAN-3]AYF39793.1 MFS transporter [Ethanoligenens harbinense]AYF42625.1 MFS transporter [Ethanoligenens harbinense]QCN93374.1 MFS transporter [Ethanoligenens harbinense]
MELWKRNLIVCWLGEFTTSCGMSIVVPFMPFYIEQMGIKDLSTVSVLSGAAFSITFVTAAVMAPVWGTLADLRGRKTVMMCTGLGLAVSNFFYPFLHSIWLLMLMRALQGVVSGYIPSANALMARVTPEKKTGWALATLSTGMMSGSLLGPVIGGYLDTTIHIRNTFFVTTASLFLSFLIAALFVKEDAGERPLAVVTHAKPGPLLPTIDGKLLFVALMATTCLINVANQSIEPIVSLFVRQLFVQSHTGTGQISLFSGIVISATGVGILLSASLIGRLADRTGCMRVLILSLLFSGILFVPMALVQNAWQLMALRFLFGISQAGIMPVVSTLLKKTSPADVFGRVFGYNQAMTYLGMVLGPLLGSLISARLGFSHIFWITAGILLGNLALVAAARRKLPAALSPRS